MKKIIILIIFIIISSVCFSSNKGKNEVCYKARCYDINYYQKNNKKLKQQYKKYSYNGCKIIQKKRLSYKEYLKNNNKNYKNEKKEVGFNKIPIFSTIFIVLLLSFLYFVILLPKF